MSPVDGRRGAGALSGLAALMLALAGCATPPPAPPPPPPPPVVVAPPPPPPTIVYVPVQAPADGSVADLLSFHDRIAAQGPAALPAELQRLGDGRASPQAAMELAVVLGQTRAPGDLVRALSLLDGVVRNADAGVWHPLARWLAQRYAEQRRAEEQAERLAQQLRDQQREHQRRVEQLNDKLEALLSIERSLNARPVPAPAPRGTP